MSKIINGVDEPEMDIYELPPDEVKRLREKVLEQIRSMDNAEFRTLVHSRESIAYFIAELARALAAVDGFIIGLPVAWAIKIVDSIGKGFAVSWKAAFISALDDIPTAEAKVPTHDIGATYHIRLLEDPLPAQTLVTIITALTELFTKFWLVQQGRFTDLVEYALSHNIRFTQEANLVFTDITHRSPFDFKFDVNLNPESAARAIQLIYDMRKLEAEKKEKASLENKALEDEIERKKQELQVLLADKEVDRQIKVREANLKFQEASIKLQNDLADLEERKLKLRREKVEFDLDFIDRVLNISKNLVDIFYPNADVDQKIIGGRIFFNNLLQLNGMEQLNFVLSVSQSTENKKSIEGQESI